MDIARYIKTNEIIDAEQLWEMEVIDKEGYVCLGCNAQVWPASFRKDFNKKRPYFTLGKNSAHIKPCDIDGEEKVVNHAKSERVGTPEGFPLPYPNMLLLVEVRETVNQSDIVCSPISQKSVSARVNKLESKTLHHGHTVKTIRSIVKTYIKYPHDRDHLPLTIPYCKGRTYGMIFWRLGKITKFHDPTHLYFAPLHWKAPTKSDLCIEWQLDAGNWDTVKNHRNPAYRVKVDYSEWSDVQRSTLIHEIELAREIAKHSCRKAWLFFVGTQDATDQTLIVVNRYQLICCLES